MTKKYCLEVCTEKGELYVLQGDVDVFSQLSLYFLGSFNTWFMIDDAKRIIEVG